MSMPILRLRDLAKGGQTIELPASVTVEVLDTQGNVALLLMPDLVSQGLKLVTSAEEPEVAKQYGSTHGVTFSQIITPALSKLLPPT
jgi:hypothetical protein